MNQFTVIESHLASSLHSLIPCYFSQNWIVLADKQKAKDLIKTRVWNPTFLWERIIKLCSLSKLLIKNNLIKKTPMSGLIGSQVIQKKK